MVTISAVGVKEFSLKDCTTCPTTKKILSMQDRRLAAQLGEHNPPSEHTTDMYQEEHISNEKQESNHSPNKFPISEPHDSVVIFR